MEKKYFTVKEALEEIKAALQFGYDGYLCDLIHHVFDKEYYVIGTGETKAALEQYGMLQAVEDVTRYEEFVYGEIRTDLSDIEELVNALYYLTGEKALERLALENELVYEFWGDNLDCEQKKSLIKSIEEILSENS